MDKNNGNDKTQTLRFCFPSFQSSKLLGIKKNSNKNVNNERIRVNRNAKSK